MTKHTICQVAKQDATFQHSKVYRKVSDILQVPLNLNTAETPTQASFSRQLQEDPQMCSCHSENRAKTLSGITGFAEGTWGLPSIAVGSERPPCHDPSSVSKCHRPLRFTNW